MGKNYPQKSLEERKQQMNEILSNLENGVREVFTSENYVRYLETFSKFHNYSYNNIILILMQYPQATYVASFKDWTTKFNRIIKKGEHGIKILVPTPKKVYVEREIQNEDGTTYKQKEEQRKLYFKQGYVFDISQTIGEELPLLVKELCFDSKELAKLLNFLFATSEVPIAYDYDLKENSASANGYYNALTKEIFLKSSLSSLHKIKTIFHEYSHYFQETIFADKTKNMDRNTKEVIAESSAYCVMEMLSNELNMEKLDSSEYSFGYIASWGSRDLNELKSTLSLISKISNLIFDWVASKFVVS